MSYETASTTSQRTPPEAGGTTGARLAASQLPVSLAFWTVSALVVTGAVLSGVLLVTDHAEWWRAFAVASAIGFASSVVAVTPVLVAGSAMRPGVKSPAESSAAVRTLMMGYLAGMMLRMMAVLALLLVSQKVLASPRVATAAFTLAYAMAALSAEVLVLVRAMSKLPVKVPVAKGSASGVAAT